MSHGFSGQGSASAPRPLVPGLRVGDEDIIQKGRGVLSLQSDRTIMWWYPGRRLHPGRNDCVGEEPLSPGWCGCSRERPALEGWWEGVPTGTYTGVPSNRRPQDPAGRGGTTELTERVSLKLR